MLTCARMYARSAREIPPNRGAEWVLRTPGLWAANRPLADALTADTAPTEVAVEVYVNEGRWVVMCPDCAGAQLAARDDHRFMCVECANVAIEGLWRPVTWPTGELLTAIEDELERRPLTRNRNWLPGESVEDLIAEYHAVLNPPEPEPEPELPTPPVDERDAS